MMPKPPALYINSHKFTHAYMLMAPTTETHIFQVQVQSQQAHIEVLELNGQLWLLLQVRNISFSLPLFKECWL